MLCLRLIIDALVCFGFLFFDVLWVLCVVRFVVGALLGVALCWLALRDLFF